MTLSPIVTKFCHLYIKPSQSIISQFPLSPTYLYTQPSKLTQILQLMAHAVK